MRKTAWLLLNHLLGWNYNSLIRPLLISASETTKAWVSIVVFSTVMPRPVCWEKAGAGEGASVKELYRDRAKTSDHPSQPRGKLSCPCFFSRFWVPTTHPPLSNSGKAEQLRPAVGLHPAALRSPALRSSVHPWVIHAPQGRRISHNRASLNAILTGTVPPKAWRKRLLLILWNVPREYNGMYQKLLRLI